MPKPMSRRQLADFIADNMPSLDDAAFSTLTIGPYEVPRTLGFVARDEMQLSSRQVKRSKTSSQTYTLTHYINGVAVPTTAGVALNPNDLFEIKLDTPDGDAVDGRIYISFTVT